ncbi:MAG: hypothetical protein IKC03_02395 [Oscillospiraceae bacterium]|nr:hypothetical protein [Oscillospiraceae bacterium]
MLTISLDEYGQFENTRASKCLVAGVVYQGTQVVRERARINHYLRECCERSGSRFPQDLHFEWKNGEILNLEQVNRTKELIQQTFREFLKGAEPEGKYFIYAVVSDRDGVSMFHGEHVGNLLLDSYAGNKYRHMTNMALHNLLINNPALRDNAYHLELATRVLKPGDNKGMVDEIKKLGMQQKPTVGGDEIYTLSDANTYIAMLSSAMLENQDKNVDFKLNVQSINYGGREDVALMQGFLYLADIVCTLLQESLHGSGSLVTRVYECANRYTTHEKNMVWHYSDTDLMLQDAIRCRIHGQWFECLSLLYDISNENKPESSYYHDFWEQRVLQEMRRELNADLLYQAALELSRYVQTPNASTGKGWYIVEQLRQMAAGQNGEKAYERSNYLIYSVLVTLCNHRGLFQEAGEYYECAIASAQYAPIDDYLELRNAYSVSLLDRLAFEEALCNTQDTKTYEELIEEIRQSIYPHADNISLHYGKTLSQLAQCHAFLEDHASAQQLFTQALQRFGEDMVNLSITRSYLLHSYIESGMQEEYEALAAVYFRAEGLRKQLDAIGAMDNTSRKFALFVFVKALRTFYLDQISKSETEQYLGRILGWKNEDLGEHPWELIWRHCAVVALTKKLTRQAELCCTRLENFASVRGDGLLYDICRESLEEAICLREGRVFQGNDKLTYMYR